MSARVTNRGHAGDCGRRGHCGQRGHLRGQRGVSLIELMIVLAIFALMAGSIVVGFSSSRTAEITRAINQIGNTARYAYDRARLNGTYHRMLINLDDNTFILQEGDDRMYLPATDRDGKLVEFDARKAEERADRDRAAAEAYNRSVQSEVYDGGGSGGSEVADYDPYKAQAREVPRRKPPLFAAFEEEHVVSKVPKAVKLPKGLKIVSVRTASDLKPITEGEVSIYFFPRGRTQQAHILLEDKETDGQWTIKFAPLTGRVTIEDGHEELKLPDDPTEAEDDLGKRRGRRSL